MSTVPELDFTSKYLTCLQVYRFLCYESFYSQAGDFNRYFQWSRVEIPAIKKFFGKMYLPSKTKHKVFLILNNKACFFDNKDDIPAGIDNPDKYIGFHLIEGKI